MDKKRRIGEEAKENTYVPIELKQRACEVWARWKDEEPAPCTSIQLRSTLHQVSEIRTLWVDHEASFPLEECYEAGFGAERRFADLASRPHLTSALL